MTEIAVLLTEKKIDNQTTNKISQKKAIDNQTDFGKIINNKKFPAKLRRNF